MARFWICLKCHAKNLEIVQKKTAYCWKRWGVVVSVQGKEPWENYLKSREECDYKNVNRTGNWNPSAAIRSIFYLILIALLPNSPSNESGFAGFCNNTCRFVWCSPSNFCHHQSWDLCCELQEIRKFFCHCIWRSISKNLWMRGGKNPQF